MILPSLFNYYIYPQPTRSNLDTSSMVGLVVAQNSEEWKLMVILPTKAVLYFTAPGTFSEEEIKQMYDNAFGAILPRTGNEIDLLT